jgi:hypothetical protein
VPQLALALWVAWLAEALTLEQAEALALAETVWD